MKVEETATYFNCKFSEGYPNLNQLALKWFMKEARSWPDNRPKNENSWFNWENFDELCGCDRDVGFAQFYTYGDFMCCTDTNAAKNKFRRLILPLIQKYHVLGQYTDLDWCRYIYA